MIKPIFIAATILLRMPRLACADASDPKQATKENPYVNSLGMKFVPVPGTKALFSIWETRVQDYLAFCAATGRTHQPARFPQQGNHPVVDVSWGDAREFCKWLSNKEHRKYRLPTDHEWSCAVGIGDMEKSGGTPESKSGKIAGRYPWGSGNPTSRDGNYIAQEWNNAAGIAKAKAYGLPAGLGLLVNDNDGYLFTAPVGTYRPNPFGIYDLGGNASEWCEDRFNATENWRVERGANWVSINKDQLLSSAREGDDPGLPYHGGWVGFRVVMEQ